MRILPVDWCISKFGGARKMAKALGVRHSTIFRMRRAKDHPATGTGGHIPTSDMQRSILVLARERGYDITPEDLIEGRMINEALVY